MLINAKQSGAIGNGITDDTRAIQQAIDKVAKDEPIELVFPDGDYLITSLSIPKRSTPVVIYGESESRGKTGGATIINNGGPMLLTSEPIAIKNLRFAQNQGGRKRLEQFDTAKVKASYWDDEFVDDARSK